MSKKSVFLALTSLLALPLIALAFDFPGQPGDTINNQAAIEKVISSIASFLFVVVMGVSVIMFIWAGLIFLTAQGDATKITTAKKMVLWGIIGIVVAILSTSIIWTVGVWLFPAA